MWSKRPGRRGLTFTETLFAFMIVALAANAFVATFPSASVAINKSRHADMAAESAYREIDAWRAVGYRSAIPGDTTDPHTRLGAVSNGVAVSVPARITLPPGLPNATVTVALRRIDSGQFAGTTPAPASPTANYPAVTPSGTPLTNFRCQIDVEVSWTGIRTDHGSTRVSSLLVEDPIPSQ